MPPHLKTLATDWKAYVAVVAAIASGLTVATDFAEKVEKAVKALHLPSQAKWLPAALLAIVTILALISIWSRKSKLLRPDRFILNSDDPNYLIGRETEVKELAVECERNTLVFLQGDSGAGKSALVQAGLTPYCKTVDRSRLLALRIDASSLDWNEGLRRELSRELKTLSETEQNQIGTSRPIDSNDFLEWFGHLERVPARQVLLIIDQMDDYAVAHWRHLVHDHTVITPEALQQTNSDWAAIAELLRRRIIHVLLVCRSDAGGILDAFRFTTPATFLLPRVDRELIKPVLEKVTHDDGQGAVVENPEHGWFQLKARLLRDLAPGAAQILPIQLTVALESLRRFQFLTPHEYAKNGGARGLERLYIERLVHEAASASGIDETAIIRGLMLLVTEDGLKTRRASRAELFQAIDNRPAKINEVDRVVAHLERGRILRPQITDGGEFYLLHHDYLARGVREVSRSANRWVELLHDRQLQFEEALNWRQHWQALLPLRAQAQLLWARLRRRFTYRENRALALWSMLRLLPVLVVIGLVGGVLWWIDRLEQEQIAESTLAAISPMSDLPGLEALEWNRLNAARKHARFHAVYIALSRPSLSDKVYYREESLARAAVHLDPSRRLTNALVSKIILPVLSKTSRAKTTSLAAGLSKYLHNGHSEASALSRGLLERMKTEQDNDELASLVSALDLLTNKLEAKDVQAVAAVLIERMKSVQDNEKRGLLGVALGGLANKLEAKDLNAARAVLIEGMKSKPDNEKLTVLVLAFAALTKAKDRQPAAVVLIERMKSEHDSGNLAELGSTLGELTKELEPKDVQQAAAVLIERMNTEQDNDKLPRLVSTLGELTKQLEPKDVQQAAAVLIERINTEQDSDKLARLVSALEALTNKLEAKDLQAIAAVLTERMKTENEEYKLESLGSSYTALTDQLGAKNLQPAAAILTERMKTEHDSYNLANLGSALGEFTNELQAKDLQSAAAVLIEQMNTEHDSHKLDMLGSAFSKLANKLEGKDAQAAAAVLTELMKKEGIGMFGSLATAVGELANKLEGKDAQRAAAVLIELMKTEHKTDTFELLGSAFGKLATKLEGKDAQAAAAVLIELMKTEQESDNLELLGSAWGALTSKLQPDDVQTAAAVLIERLRVMPPDDQAFPGLSRAIANLSDKFQPESLQTVLAVLNRRFPTQGFAGLGKDWVTIERRADAQVDKRKRIQIYVDLLRSPVIRDDAFRSSKERSCDDRQALVHGLEQITGTQFGGDQWRFIDWATTTQEGKSLHLDLGN